MGGVTAGLPPFGELVRIRSGWGTAAGGVPRRYEGRSVGHREGVADGGWDIREPPRFMERSLRFSPWAGNIYRLMTFGPHGGRAGRIFHLGGLG